MSQPDRKVDFSTPEVTRSSPDLARPARVVRAGRLREGHRSLRSAARFLTEPPAPAEQGPG